MSMPGMREEAVGKAALVLGAARRAFLASGFGAVSMDTIAREAGVSKATVYAHFGSKEELFGAVVADVAEQRFAGFSALELDPTDVEASLETIARRFLDLVLSREAVAVNRIIIGEVIRFPALGDVFWQAGPERNRQQIEEFLRRAAEVGSLNIDDPRLAAEQFASLVRGESHLRSLFGLDEPQDSAALGDIVTNAVATFLRAFGGR
ncbi:MAG: TetR/AcrR family transcriptional regulator [Alphaproteobacteria bacterium]|nr:TetR/AcrR family transcriptional regulator [Alphaproteobacteria bacterium]MBV9587283.1 TetR/AcrR family transcriptional regulator [Alphaproteobacteria bacterium]